MFLSSRSVFVLGFLSLFIQIFVSAETHTIKFDNQCGRGSPRLIQKGNVLSTGEDFVSTGPFSSAIAWISSNRKGADINSCLVLKADISAGNCLLNGEGCTLVEMTLVNPTCPGCGSSTDISLIPPLAFSVPVTFSYFGGCDGQGATCSSAKCDTAFFVPDDNQVQVACQEDNANLLITFCGNSGNTAVPSSTAAAGLSTIAGNVSSKPAAPTAAAGPATIASSVSSKSTAPTAAPMCSRTRAKRSATLRASIQKRSLIRPGGLHRRRSLPRISM